MSGSIRPLMPGRRHSLRCLLALRLRRRFRFGLLKSVGVMVHSTVAGIERQSKAIAEGGQRPLGGIGLGGLGGPFMRLARRWGIGFTCS